VEKAKRLGATGVKILLLYHPASDAADKQDALVSNVLRECARLEIPLFLEPIAYSLDPTIAKGTQEFARERRRIVMESVKRLGALKPDVLKVEFPVDVKFENDRAVWAEACAELNDASPVPWALLSADEPFDVFQEQLRVACENGCSGFLVGRAVWRDAATLGGNECKEFLTTTAHARFQTLMEIAAQSAKPWHTRYAMPKIDENWYRDF
jgi:tagatose-1,6-bisphosphate aldolase